MTAAGASSYTWMPTGLISPTVTTSSTGAAKPSLSSPGSAVVKAQMAFVIVALGAAGILSNVL